MHIKRIQDSSYPCIYDSWRSENATWVVQDLRPEDEDAAMEILMEDMLNDEVLCGLQKLSADPVSMQEVNEFWRECLQQRMSLGCYVEKNGQKTLVALNVCGAGSVGDEHKYQFKGEKWRNVFAALEYADSLVNPYKRLGLDTILHAFGLIVKREYRGRRIGQKVLNAREPLCLSQGIRGTVTVFTGVASQKSASRCGFHTIAEFSIRELAEAGLAYPRDDERIIKFMAKKYE